MKPRHLGKLNSHVAQKRQNHCHLQSSEGSGIRTKIVLPAKPSIECENKDIFKYTKSLESHHMFFLLFLEDMAQKNNMQKKIKRQEDQELQASLSCTSSHRSVQAMSDPVANAQTKREACKRQGRDEKNPEYSR